MMRPIGARMLIRASVSGLIVLLLLGGGVLALVEKTGYREGVWLAFNVISTTGFGDGPNTLGRQLLSMILFALAAIHWFGIILGIALRRLGRYPTASQRLPTASRWRSLRVQ